MHVTHIYFIRRFMNLYVWDIRGALHANTHIHQRHSEGGRQCLKNFVFFKVFIKDHRLAEVDESVLKERDWALCVRACARALELDVALYYL